MRLIPFNPSWASPVAAEFCAEERSHRHQIHAALRDGLFYNQQCVITYQQPGQQDWVNWTVHPLMYLQCTPASYLLCAMDDSAEVRPLALHRMQSVQVLARKARSPVGFNADREIQRLQADGPW